MQAISFAAEAVLPPLEAADLKELDQLDFGVVIINKAGKIKAYNKYQAAQANEVQGDVLGKNFFTEVAPCTNNFMVAGKFTDASKARDEVMEYIFTYKAKPVKVKLRLIVDPDREDQYLFIQNL